MRQQSVAFSRFQQQQQQQQQQNQQQQQQHHQQFSKCRTLAFILQLMVSASILQMQLTNADATVISGESQANDLPNLPVDSYEEKRNWQSLQGSWGKRLADSSEPISGIDNELLLAEQWMPVLLGSANRNTKLNSNTNPDRDEIFSQYPLAYPRLGALPSHSDEQAVANDLSDLDLGLSHEDLDRVDDILNEKRTWKTMNVAWGKRRNAPGWNKFRGAWGKREPGWNNLKGMWGKRSSANWQKLHPGWGKRTQTN